MSKKNKFTRINPDLIPLLIIAVIFVMVSYFHTTSTRKNHNVKNNLGLSGSCWLSAKEEIDSSIDDIMEQNRPRQGRASLGRQMLQHQPDMVEDRALGMEIG